MVVTLKRRKPMKTQKTQFRNIKEVTNLLKLVGFAIFLFAAILEVI
jgi:hypothetical protein